MKKKQIKTEDIQYEYEFNTSHSNRNHINALTAGLFNLKAAGHVLMIAKNLRLDRR